MYREVKNFEGVIDSLTYAHYQAFFQEVYIPHSVADQEGAKLQEFSQGIFHKMLECPLAYLVMHYASGL